MAGGKRRKLTGNWKWRYWLCPCPYSESDTPMNTEKEQKDVIAGVAKQQHYAIIPINPEWDNVGGPEEDIYRCPICGKDISGKLIKAHGWQVEIGETTHLNVRLKRTYGKWKRKTPTTVKLPA